MTIYVQVQVANEWMQKGGWDAAVKHFAAQYPKMKFKVVNCRYGHTSGALLCFEDELHFTKFSLTWKDKFYVVPIESVKIRSVSSVV